MGKTIQFMFILFVVGFCGVGVYFGMTTKSDVEAIYKRIAEVEKENAQLRNQIKALLDFSAKGSAKVVKNDVDLSKFPGAKPEDKDVKPKVGNGFYCDVDGGEGITIVKFYDDGSFKFWNLNEEKLTSFNDTVAHDGKGEYIIHGMELYATVDTGVFVQKRVLSILSIDKNGTILQLHGAGNNFLPATCPAQIQSF